MNCGGEIASFVEDWGQTEINLFYKRVILKMEPLYTAVNVVLCI